VYPLGIGCPVRQRMFLRRDNSLDTTGPAAELSMASGVIICITRACGKAGGKRPRKSYPNGGSRIKWLSAFDWASDCISESVSEK
jgi:hypothetical protein